MVGARGEGGNALTKGLEAGVALFLDHFLELGFFKRFEEPVFLVFPWVGVWSLLAFLNFLEDLLNFFGRERIKR